MSEKRESKADVADARKLWRYLADGKWAKTKQIRDATGLNGVTIRLICSTYAGHFISNTQQGYKLTSRASEDEIQHSINDLRSRCDKMQTRANALEAVLIEREQGQLGL